MAKSRALVSQSDSLKKKKFKVDEITCEQVGGTEEMNGKKKKTKTKKREADDEVCEYAENISDENIQMIHSADTNTHEQKTHKQKQKKKKKKAEVLETSTHLNGHQEENIRKKKKKSEVCVPVENITEELQDEHMKKKKKRKHKDSEAVAPKSDPVTAQEEETNTPAAEERAEKKRKKRKKSAADPSGDVNSSVQQEPSGVKDENGFDGEEELSPEEKRVLERKMKKILKKEEKKQLKEEGKSIKPEKNQISVAEKEALEYLKCWSEKREEWKFKKVRQTWLLNNMYDSVKVSDDDFEVMLTYVDGLCGKARDSTLKKAEVIMLGEGEEINSAEKKQLRAKRIVQML